MPAADIIATANRHLDRLNAEFDRAIDGDHRDCYDQDLDCPTLAQISANIRHEIDRIRFWSQATY